MAGQEGDPTNEELENTSTTKSKPCMTTKQKIILFVVLLIVFIMGLLVIALIWQLWGCKAGYVGDNCDICASGYHRSEDECISMYIFASGIAMSHTVLDTVDQADSLTFDSQNITPNVTHKM